MKKISNSDINDIYFSNNKSKENNLKEEKKYKKPKSKNINININLSNSNTDKIIGENILNYNTICNENSNNYNTNFPNNDKKILNSNKNSLFECNHIIFLFLSIFNIKINFIKQLKIQLQIFSLLTQKMIF